MNNVRCQRCNAPFRFDASQNVSAPSSCAGCGLDGTWWTIVTDTNLAQPTPIADPLVKKRLSVKRIALGLLVGLVCVVGLSATYGSHKIQQAKMVLELEQVNWQWLEIRNVSSRMTSSKKTDWEEAKGQELWAKFYKKYHGPKKGLMHLVSLESKSVHESWSPEDYISENCSYTLPKGKMLAEVMTYKGPNRCVMVTFNSKNWDNYDGEIVVLWSESGKPEFLSFDYFRDNYDITEEEWADPAGKLFGIKAPFQHTYE